MKAMVTVRAEVPQSSKELLGGLEVGVGDVEVGCCGSVTAAGQGLFGGMLGTSGGSDGCLTPFSLLRRAAEQGGSRRWSPCVCWGVPTDFRRTSESLKATRPLHALPSWPGWGCLFGSSRIAP